MGKPIFPADMPAREVAKMAQVMYDGMIRNVANGKALTVAEFRTLNNLRKEIEAFNKRNNIKE